MREIDPQPPIETAEVRRVGCTDSFDCLSSAGEFLAVVHRPLGGSEVPVCVNGRWVWCEERE